MPSGELLRLPSHAVDDDLDAVWRELRASGVLVLESAATTPAEFERVTEQLATRFRIHQDPERQRYVDDDTIQGVSPGAEGLALHAERAYLPAPPDLLFFWCAVPSSNGGATTVCDGAAIVDALSADDRRELSAMTLVWTTALERPMWQRMWHTTEPARAAALLDDAISRDGERASYSFDGDRFHVEYHTPALRSGWIGGRPAFANYLLLSAEEPTGPQAAQPSGEPVPPELLRRVRAAADELTIDIAWRRGDVAVIDNTRCMHGRRPFGDGARRILVRMGEVHPRFHPGSS
jgi:alpha-ketoglutarate-dependent taurine dioxygenase